MYNILTACKVCLLGRLIVHLTPQSEVTGHLTPQSEVTGHLTPQSEVTGHLTPQSEVTGHLTPQSEVTGHLTPQSEVTGHLTPQSEVTGHLTPQSEVTGHLTPQSEVTGHLTPQSEVTGHLTPQSEVTGHLTPQSEVTGHLTPQSEVTGHLTPQSEVTGHLTPQSEVTGHLTPAETHRSWSMNLLLLSPKRIVSGSHCTSRRSRRGQFCERQIMIWSMWTRILRRRNQPFAVPIDRILQAQTTCLPLFRQAQLKNIHKCPQQACSQPCRHLILNLSNNCLLTEFMCSTICGVWATNGQRDWDVRSRTHTGE